MIQKDEVVASVTFRLLSNSYSSGLQDLKNLVKSIYEVLGKSMSRPKSSQKDPVKKLCVRLSLSKERSRDMPDTGRPECLLTTNNPQEHPKKSKARRYAAVEREGSMTVNPPSTDFLSQVRPQSSLGEPTHPDYHGRSGVHHRRSSSCRRCEQRQSIEKDGQKNGTRRAFNPVDSKGMYHYPKRMQTGPGECNPPSSNSNDMARVKEWINQWSHTSDKNEHGTTEEYQRHKHKHRHRVCQADSCEVGCGLRRCPQYLDLATDHLTYPYHTGSQSFACGDTSPRPQHHQKHSEDTHCKHNCCRDSDMYHHDRQPVIHRHEHHHHHSHHHYHHYVS